MKTLLRAIAVLLMAAPFARAQNIEGDWKLTGMIYDGKEIPMLNPQLNMRWTFYANGTDRLYWDRENESGFCERFAHYTLKDDQIELKVFALNPRNNPECSMDPDMRVGRVTTTPIKIQQQKIYLSLQIAEAQLVYIFQEVL